MFSCANIWGQKGLEVKETLWGSSLQWNSLRSWLEFLEEITQTKSNFSLGSFRIHSLNTREKLRKTTVLCELCLSRAISGISLQETLCKWQHQISQVTCLCNLTSTSATSSRIFYFPAHYFLIFHIYIVAIIDTYMLCIKIDSRFVSYIFDM